MADLICIMVILVGFGLAQMYVKGCDRLKGERP
jgi:hypothetical protein